MKILTVEDDEINALIMDRVLQDLSFKYEHKIAKDGNAALEKANNDNFDLILMDINLGNGKMDGSEVMKTLRTKNNYQSTPIFAVTCYAMDSDKKRFLSEGFDKFFPKPVNNIELIQTIENLNASQK